MFLKTSERKTEVYRPPICIQYTCIQQGQSLGLINLLLINANLSLFVCLFSGNEVNGKLPKVTDLNLCYCCYNSVR